MHEWRKVPTCLSSACRKLCRLTSASSQKYSSSHSMRQHINELVVTHGEQIICVPPRQDIQLAASLGSEKWHALAMFQALTGRDTASVLNLLNMDRKNYIGSCHGTRCQSLLHSQTFRTEGCCTHVCAEDSTNTHCSGTACLECCLPGWSCLGSNPCYNLCFLLWCMGQDW